MSAGTAERWAARPNALIISPDAGAKYLVGEAGLFMRKERGAYPVVDVAYRFHACQHCDEAPCMAACPVEGAIYKRDDGLVVIDTDTWQTANAAQPAPAICGIQTG